MRSTTVVASSVLSAIAVVPRGTLWLPQARIVMRRRITGRLPPKGSWRRSRTDARCAFRKAATYGAYDLVGRDGFPQDARHFEVIVIGCGSCHHDNRNIAGVSVCRNLLPDYIAVHNRQPQIEEHEIWRSRIEDPQGVQPVACFPDGEAFVREGGAKHAAHVRIIFYDQNGLHYRKW
jgi:hypothetical protein